LAIELTKTFVEYQAQSKLLELGDEVARVRSYNKPDVKEKIVLATKIRLWLKALQYSDFLERNTIEKLTVYLAELCDANALPYAPTVTTVSAPSFVIGIVGRTGETGADGPEGGGVPFTQEGVDEDTIIDSFSISEADGVDYSIIVKGPDGMRVQRLVGGWSDDGSDYDDDGGDGTDNIYGDTSPVTLSIVVTGSTAQLFAAVTDGVWTIKGTRKYIPNNGNGIVQPSSLASGKVWIGSTSNVPVSQTLSGDVTISTAGVTAIGTGVIVNSDISASASISVSKLEALTASRAIVTNSSGVLTPSTVSDTQIVYLSNVTSDIQSQLDSKVGTADGAISTVVATNLVASRALTSNPLGKIAVSNVTTTELGYVSGVTSAIQTQFSGKQATITGAASSVTTSNLPTYRVVITDSDGKLMASTTDAFNVDTGLNPGIGDTDSIGEDIDFSTPLQDMALTLKTKTQESSAGTTTFTAGVKGSRIYEIRFGSTSNGNVSITADGEAFTLISANATGVATKNYVNSTDMPGTPIERDTEQPFIPVGAGATVTLTNSSACAVLVTYVDLE
jgi:hypothetical protein